MTERSPIFAASIHAVFSVAILFSLFLLFAGHNAPGGGFVGGLVAGAAFVLRYIDGGVAEVRRAARVPPTALIGGGVVLAVVTGFAGLLLGGAFLESSKVEVDVALLGTVKATTALPFDIGVYLVVVGLSLAALVAFGQGARTR